ncbi:hypothetical protein LTR84_000213 [Exophiala bonariae]|uniref:Transcription factor CBF/NF-Y/archaeal histone domain-containing protein n=1 Tax=Exophiala bonariae TaxID=1690606 RepID=A0AAV9NTX9_9EURO|nr:hypothetical protein LTR84_000213 [Exophiala bonariae]
MASNEQHDQEQPTTTTAASSAINMALLQLQLGCSKHDISNIPPAATTNESPSERRERMRPVLNKLHEDCDLDGGMECPAVVAARGTFESVVKNLLDVSIGIAARAGRAEITREDVATAVTFFDSRGRPRTEPGTGEDGEGESDQTSGERIDAIGDGDNDGDNTEVK